MLSKLVITRRTTVLSLSVRLPCIKALCCHVHCHTSVSKVSLGTEMVVSGIVSIYLQWFSNMFVKKIDPKSQLKASSCSTLVEHLPPRG